MAVAEGDQLLAMTGDSCIDNGHRRWHITAHLYTYQYSKSVFSGAYKLGEHSSVHMMMHREAREG